MKILIFSQHFWLESIRINGTTRSGAMPGWRSPS